MKQRANSGILRRKVRVVLKGDGVELYSMRGKEPFERSDSQRAVSLWLGMNNYQPEHEEQGLEGIWTQPDNPLAGLGHDLMKLRSMRTTLEDILYGGK